MVADRGTCRLVPMSFVRVSPCVALWIAALALSAGAARAEPPPVLHVAASARALESKLLAPCCWNQTLDVHDSDLSRDLHREIVARIAGAEPAEAIERDLILRYGERMLAVPSSSPLSAVALSTLLLIFFAGVRLWIVAWRWRDAGNREPYAGDEVLAKRVEPQDVYEEQITRELAAR
jgi:cytochrome c-type biogenesis protein CcmH